MNYYFAPMEGLTDSIYRSLHHRYFPGIDCYYMPFYTPSIHKALTKKEQRELPPAGEVPAIPQLLTRNAEDFLWAAQLCRDLGYTQVDLNLGCPSGTVVSKGRGAGMLADPEALDNFLREIFSRTPIAVSVKTRLGLFAGDWNTAIQAAVDSGIVKFSAGAGAYLPAVGGILAFLGGAVNLKKSL